MFFIEVEKATNLDFANSYKENLPKKSEFDSMVELKLESKNWKDHFVWWSLVIIETEKQLNYKLSNYPEWFVK